MVENQVNILIKSYLDDKAFNMAQKALSNMRYNMENFNKKVASGLNVQEQSGLFKEITGQAMGFREEMVQNAYLGKFGLGLNNLAKAATTGSVQFQALQQDLRGGGWEIFNNQIRGSSGLMKKFGFDVSQVKRQFAMQALGIMFFGMMIQKVFQRLATSTVSDFMKITQGMTESGQAVNTLTVYMDLLKFSVGQAIAGALEALLPVIIPIIMAITDWVQKHEKLTGTLVALGIGIGGVLFLVGQFWLGLKSLGQAIDALFGVNLGQKIGAAGGLFKWLATNPLVWVITALILVIYFMEKLANSKYPETAARVNTDAASRIKDGWSRATEGLGTFIATLFTLNHQMDENASGATYLVAIWLWLKEQWGGIIQLIGGVIDSVLTLGSVVLKFALSGAAVLTGNLKAAVQYGKEGEDILNKWTKRTKELEVEQSKVRSFTDILGELKGETQKQKISLTYSIDISAIEQATGLTPSTALIQQLQKQGFSGQQLQDAIIEKLETGTVSYDTNTISIQNNQQALNDLVPSQQNIVELQQGLNSAFGGSSESTMSATQAIDDYNKQIGSVSTSTQDLINNLPTINDLKGTIFDAKTVEEIDKNTTAFKTSVASVSASLLGGAKAAPVTVGGEITTSGATKDVTSLAASFSRIIDLVSGKSGSVINAFTQLQETFVKQQTYIETTLLRLYDSLFRALLDNQFAADSAASAHERYNRALQGATSP